MRIMAGALVVVLLASGSARADIVYDGDLLSVEIVYPPDLEVGYGRLVELVLRITGKQGFRPSSFDGVMRDGVLNGAAGITGELYHQGHDSRFLDDPSDLLVVNPVLLPGYVPDPRALTGLFAVSTPHAVASQWDLAAIVVPGGSVVGLDFTIGEVGGYSTEYVGAFFTAPGTPRRPGDINGDGLVDLEDFAILKRNFGITRGATWGMGDLNGDGAVDLDDFVILKRNFGAIAPLPEPSSMTLMIGAAGLLAGRWARFRRRTGSRENDS